MLEDENTGEIIIKVNLGQKTEDGEFINAAAECESKLISAALELANYNKSLAAKMIGWNRGTLLSKIKKHNVLTDSAINSLDGCDEFKREVDAIKKSKEGSVNE